MTPDELREAVAVAFGGTQPFVEDYAKADAIIALVLEDITAHAVVQGTAERIRAMIPGGPDV